MGATITFQNPRKMALASGLQQNGRLNKNWPLYTPNSSYVQIQDPSKVSQLVGPQNLSLALYLSANDEGKYVEKKFDYWFLILNEIIALK